MYIPVASNNVQQLRLPGALLAAGPPCSLFVWLCCSVHRRHELGVRGDERNVKVKLSNYITENLAFWNWNWLRLVYVLDCFSMVWLLFVTLACVMVLPCFAIFFPHVFPVPCWSETERDFKTSSCFEQLCQYLIIFDIFRYILNIFELF